MFLLILGCRFDYTFDFHFTFQYVSINTGIPFKYIHVMEIFTFQYVSINTEVGYGRILLRCSFTFQYVSINTTLITPPMDDLFSLHSNMFLLIQMRDAGLIPKNWPLHSNMFLLIPISALLVALERIHFTFQYVSINTRSWLSPTLCGKSLHSNMFLLIRKRRIKRTIEETPLHSNMFLLIRC